MKEAGLHAETSFDGFARTADIGRRGGRLRSFSALRLRPRSNALTRSDVPAPRARGGDHRSDRLEAHADELLSLGKDIDMTLTEFVDRVLQAHDLRAAPGTIWRLLDRHDMTYKRDCARPRNQVWAAAARHSLPTDRLGSRIDLEPERLVCIDETGGSTRMARRNGRALRVNRHAKLTP